MIVTLEPCMHIELFISSVTFADKSIENTRGYIWTFSYYCQRRKLKIEISNPLEKQQRSRAVDQTARARRCTVGEEGNSAQKFVFGTLQSVDRPVDRPEESAHMAQDELG